MKKIITIDGPAGSGKSTISRLIAKKIGFLYLDTGAMYRALAFQVKRMGIDLNSGKELHKICKDLDLNFVLDGDNPRIHIGEEDISVEIRTPDMDMLSSSISMNKEVREAMTELQRKIGIAGRLVAEGRDMGTVVFPNADYKFFITASLEVRARRRYMERLGRGEIVSKEDVEAELAERDKQDETRPFAPLRPAEDAIIIDTTTLGIEQVLGEILSKVGKTDIGNV